MVAKVVINSIAKDLDKAFDYITPASLEKELKIGSRVIVPFGTKKTQEGFVIEINEDSDFATKEIIKIEDTILTNENIDLAKLMSKRYFCNLSDCIRLMLPPGDTNKDISKRVKDKQNTYAYLGKHIDINEINLKSEKQNIVLKFLAENNEVLLADLINITQTSKAIINTLLKKDYIYLVERKVQRNPFINKNIIKDKPLNLTAEQIKAYTAIKDSKFKEFLLYGVTGSRKNRDIFTTYRRCNKSWKNSNCFSSRNITYTSNGR